MHVWRKIVQPGRAESWTAQLLAGGVAPERLVVVQPAAGSPYGLNHAAGFAEDVGGSSVRLEIYCERAAEAHRLVRDFGGRARTLRPGEWERWLSSSAIDRPLPIGRRLLVSNQPEELARLRAEQDPSSGRQVLCIPAAMAFGTGEHATTAMCLRLLDAIARERKNAPWDLLDLGAGSGILALAGTLLGARHALGLDNDRRAVRTARENARLNAIPPRRARFARADLPGWKPARGAWPVIAANLFSDLLVRLLPAVIAPALAPGGDLILSGVLASQTGEVAAAVHGAQLALLETKRRGRWRAFRCRNLG